MKTKTLTCLAGLCLVTASEAGTPASTRAGTCEGDLWNWFSGASAGYVTGVDEAMYAVRFGMVFQDVHSFYLEIGWTRDDADFSAGMGIPGARAERAGIDADIIPITLNYRYEAALSERWNGFAGLGAGFAIVDRSYEWSWSQALPPPAPNQGGGSDDETVVRLYGDVFAGLSCDVNEAFQVFAGARWIFMDEDEQRIDVAGVSDYETGIHNEFLFELGATWSF